MSITPAPSHSVVKYQSPMERAYSASGKTALGLVIALLIPLLTLGIKYLVTGDFSHTAFVALLTAAGVSAGGVLLQFLLKLQSATSDNVLPTVNPADPAPPAAIFAPPITPDALHDILTMAKMLQEWQRPVEQPPATISHRVVTPTPITGTGASMTIGGDAPVKRSHHAAKVPTVAPPIDAVSDH